MQREAACRLRFGGPPLVLLLLAGLVPCRPARPQTTAPGNCTFLVERTTFRTHLLDERLPPGDQAPVLPPAGAQQVVYPSGSLTLKAWLAFPRSMEPQRARWPAVVYFHGGFSLDQRELPKCAPLLEAGFVVMLPMLRGENGNPGHFELLMGEIDDARAAINWLVAQPYVLPDRVFAFGHSIGAGVADMLPLFDDVPIVHSGSCSGLYTERSLLRMSERPGVPFDIDSGAERRLRLLQGHQACMRRPHFAFLGEAEYEEKAAAFQEEIPRRESLLRIARVEGDHHSALRPAMEAYIAAMADDGSSQEGARQ